MYHFLSDSKSIMYRYWMCAQNMLKYTTEGIPFYWAQVPPEHDFHDV